MIESSDAAVRAWSRRAYAVAGIALAGLVGQPAVSATAHPRAVVVRAGHHVRAGRLGVVEAFVPAHRSCRLSLRRRSHVVRSRARVARRTDIQFLWRVPRRAAAARWHARVTCARAAPKAHLAVLRSAPATLRVTRRRGSHPGHRPIAVARRIRMTSIAAEPALRIRAAGWPGWGAVLVSGSAWKIPGASGRTCGKGVTWPCGVDVHSNNWAGWPLSPDTAFGAFGSYKWQCVELIERFLNLVGWYKGILPAPGGKAANMYGAAPRSAFVKHPNGSGYRPVPGDIVVYSGHEFGHIAIVESDNAKNVVVLEQNVKYENGRGTNPWQGKTLLPQSTWAGFSVTGFLHAKANTGTAAGPPIAIGVCGARGEGAPPSPGGICTLQADGSERRQITHGVDSEPAWAPDHRKLAFVRLEGGQSHIDVVNADGSGLRPLTGGSADHTPAWSPDGKKIAYSRDGEIAVADVATGAVTPLTSGPVDYDPSWSADGSLIAFASGTAPAEIDVMSSTGADRHYLVTGIQPAWAPSGPALAFTRYADSGSHIATTNGVTGTPIHDLTTGQSDNSYAPAWSPDGKRLAFGRGQDMENPGVWVMNADGSHQTRLFGGYDPAWR